MSMFDAFKVAGSAVSAQSQRLNAVASNLANADSAAGPNGAVYKAKQVVFETMQIASEGTGKFAEATGSTGPAVGVKVKEVIEDQSPARKVYDPKHPLADDQGYIQLPNVNPVDEVVNMISASRSYQNNIEVMNTAKSLMLKTLTLGN
jgi:flagellar basal-body rod protein FlgC